MQHATAILCSRTPKILYMYFLGTLLWKSRFLFKMYNHSSFIIMSIQVT